MFDAQVITPLRPEEIAELSEFLAAGFGRAADDAYASPEVLNWKYFDPCGAQEQPRSFIARDRGTIVAHLGVCPRAFVSVGFGSEGAPIRTVHFVDWLASRAHPSTGLMLMMRGFRTAETQYALGGSAAGRQMAQKVGYETISTVPAYGRILRPAYQWRSADHGILGRLLRVGKDLGRTIVQTRLPPRVRIELLRIQRFGEEVPSILMRFPRTICTTTRTPELLNHYLRYPRGTFSGWTIHAEGTLVGFGMISIVPEGTARKGKIIECFLDRVDGDYWRAAIAALTRELGRQSADYVTGFGSTPWACEAFEADGFVQLNSSDFQLRDKKKLISREKPFHLTFLEADHGYL